MPQLPKQQEQLKLKMMRDLYGPGLPLAARSRRRSLASALQARLHTFALAFCTQGTGAGLLPADRPYSSFTSTFIIGYCRKGVLHLMRLEALLCHLLTTACIQGKVQVPEHREACLELQPG